jgi:hypothetical protein
MVKKLLSIQTSALGELKLDLRTLQKAKCSHFRHSSATRRAMAPILHFVKNNDLVLAGEDLDWVSQNGGKLMLRDTDANDLAQ